MRLPDPKDCPTRHRMIRWTVHVTLVLMRAAGANLFLPKTRRRAAPSWVFDRFRRRGYVDCLGNSAILNRAFHLSLTKRRIGKSRNALEKA